jgi:uncharacterized protein YraI
VNQKNISIILLALLLAGCGIQADMNEAATPTEVIVTSTPPASLTPPSSQTPLLPPPTPTVVPVTGTTSTQVNVRAEPSTAGKVLGLITANATVEIIGKDPGENWWQILYPQAADGKGWVAAQFITTAAKPEVPVIGGGGVTAIIQQQLNVRSGPGTDFNSVGTLNPQDVVTLTGKDANGTWLQIDFSSGPEGKGWLSAAFVQANGVENLPIVTSGNVIVGTGTPTVIPSLSVPTVIPAAMDNDSANHPLASVIFNPVGTRTMIFSGDVSAPNGDTEDWVGFTPYGALVALNLQCSGSDSLEVDILENNLPLSVNIVCDDQIKAIAVQPTQSFLVHLQAIPSSGSLQYINYTLTIKANP